jgi:carbamate kinase
MSKKLVVIALGGNAIKQAHEKGTTEEQFLNVDIAARQIAKIVKAGWEVVVTHGNGPQAGSLLIQQEEASSLVPGQTLTAVGAMTQGQIGWMFQNRLAFHLQNEELDNPVCSVITQVEVSGNDPDFRDPSKPVGPFFTEADAKAHSVEKGWIVKEVKPGVEKSWRRVVPSPEPISIVEERAISSLIEKDVIVIASGGGGIPVEKASDGSWTGIDAVIDKDRSGFILSKTLEADTFMILTDVRHVYINFNRPDQESLKTINLDEAQKYMDEGQFLSGSMGPKVEACMRFVKWSCRDAVITSLDNALSALTENTGTRIKA